MDDAQFIARINRILGESGSELPFPSPAEVPDGGAVARWAAFLEACVKAGIQLSDARWQQLTVVRHGSVVELELDPSHNSDTDDEFKVGLQLLMGLLGGRTD